MGIRWGLGCGGRGDFANLEGRGLRGAERRDQVVGPGLQEETRLRRWRWVFCGGGGGGLKTHLEE